MNGMAQWSVPPSRVDAQSPTGYADGRRVGLSPGRSEEAFPWILQTQALVTGGPWRPERVDYDNAPLGRELHDPWLYRLWLALVARVETDSWVDWVVGGVRLTTTTSLPALVVVE